MDTRVVKAGQSFTYEHPGERDGSPQEVAHESARDLERAAMMFARHTEATVRQVRNGAMSRELSLDPQATPEALKALWESSAEAKACIVLIRSAKAANTAVKRIRELQTGQKQGPN